MEEVVGGAKREKGKKKNIIKDTIKTQDSDFILLHSWCCHQ
jgi:hypothetical protein